MKPILNAEQIRQADAYTIANEPISSVDLMERAAVAFVNKFSEIFGSNHRIKVFCGTGNNGGDALAIARMLLEKQYEVTVFTTGYLGKTTDDFRINFDRFLKLDYAQHIDVIANFPHLSEDDILIDGLFGSGLTRPVEGFYGDVIQSMNASGGKIVSIDIASGLMADQSIPGDHIIRPHKTISFQTSKLAFFQPALHCYVGNWYVVDIELDNSFIEGQKTNVYFTEEKDIVSRLKPRATFMHKGDAGRLLLIAGSKGKMGAAVMASRAAMRMGAGLLMVHAPACGTDILQIAVPEAMVSVDKNENCITEMPHTFSANAIAIGPGIGTEEKTMVAFKSLLENAVEPMVIDADAINLIALNPKLLALIPKDSILTPHPGEFKRLVGEWRDDYHKLEMLQIFCANHKVNVVIKGAYSAVCDSTGKIHFNPTGNPGMATAGSGDVLTGMVASLLGQGYLPADALLLGVYMHGLAGDLAEIKIGEQSLIASDIVENIPNMIHSLQKRSTT
ncbi:MAG: hydroxyethylthiazole kinase-like uncharacterized protein yjeF [Cyclobacteriaceae bacterium]|jgi:hydroxyethylthiazole kinase-like uncharacterized protein yjeF